MQRYGVQRTHRFKASETLLGIETYGDRFGLILGVRFKASETLLGIETMFISPMMIFSRASKPLKPF